MRPTGRTLRLWVDRLDEADRNAGVAVDALLGMDRSAVRPDVATVGGSGLDALGDGATRARLDDDAGHGVRGYSTVRRRALTATTTVERLIRTAPTAGLRTTPQGARTPAASGIATML